jgi:hypothetical protein
MQSGVTIVSSKTILTSAMIYDIRSRKVCKVVFRNKSNYQIDLSSLEAVVYFMEIATENNTITKRIIKK